MSKIIITFAIFSLATALPDNYYNGAPTDAPIVPTPDPGPITPSVDPGPGPITPSVTPDPAGPITTTTPVAPDPTPTTTPAPPPPQPPTEDLIQVLTKKGNFKQLIEAITKSGLTDQLKNITTGLATIFAPNDNAFKKLPEGTTIETLTKEDLEKIIKR